MIDDDDLPGYLIDAFRVARSKGLKHILAVEIGEATKMWQVSTRFRNHDSYHVAIDTDLFVALMDALTPPTQAPVGVRAKVEALAGAGDPHEDMMRDDHANDRAFAPGGLFDEDNEAKDPFRDESSFDDPSTNRGGDGVSGLFD